MRVRDGVLAVFALALAGFFLTHQWFPSLSGITTMVESVLPWLGLIIPVLLIIGLLGRARAGLVALLVPALAWVALFGPVLAPKGAATTAQLTVVSQNIGADNPDPCATLSKLAAQDADVVAVQEMAGNVSGCTPLSEAYEHHFASSSVSVWSKYPLRASEPMQFGLAWARALRTEVKTPYGNVAVYAVHLPSARPGETVQRNRGLTELADEVAADDASRVLVVGDLNTASTDRAMRAFGSFEDTQQVAGTGFGFTWPTALPITRPDHMLTRGLTPLSAGTLPGAGSDHLGINATFTVNSNSTTNRE